MNVWGQLIKAAPKIKLRKQSTEYITVKIVEYITANPGCTASDIRESLDLDAAPLQDKLCALEKQGRIWSRVQEVSVRRPHAGRYAKHFWGVQ